MKRTTKNIISIAVITLIFTVVLVFNILALTVFDNGLTILLGGMQQVTGSSELDLKYNKTTFASEGALKTAEEALSIEIGENGIVMLKHDDRSGMPFANNTTFSVFSQSSVRFVTGGTGSGSGGTAKTSLKQAFENNNLKINNSLWDFYDTGEGKNYKRGIGSVDYGDDEDYSIGECPISVITSDTSLVNSFNGTTAMFVLSRTGGEGRDLARSMVNHATSAEDQNRHYLQLDSTERAIFDYLQSSEVFSEIVLIVNCNNAIELGWTADYSKIHTILQIPGTGSAGINALPRILTGAVNPSGKLVDTYAYDSFSAPAAENCDEGLYFPNGNVPVYKQEGNDAYYYTAYLEGIYVGYKYYETRYEDKILNQGNAGYYDYATTVQYPFGYGLSLTEFEWSNFSIDWKGKNCTVSVDIKNIGTKPGREVVQVYVQTPYTQYDIVNGIEKSSVQLVGFAKTELLQIGGIRTVNITFSEEEFKAYDSKSAKTYILDKGDYFITAAKDAHAAINNIILAKDETKASSLVASPSESIAGDKSFVGVYAPNIAEDAAVDLTTYNSDSKSGKEIENQLERASLDELEYLSRNDWIGTYPQPYGEVSEIDSNFGNRVNGGNASAPKSYKYKLNLPTDEYNKIRSTESHNPITDSSYTAEVVVGATNNDIQFIELRGLPYDHDKWDKFIAQFSAGQMADFIAKGGYGTIQVSSVKKHKTTHLDGPSGFGTGYNFCSEILLAQTWDTALAQKMGEYVGEEGIFKKQNGWYAPAMNIHRTPFSGRNFEYYSEDAFLSGSFGTATVTGAGSKGIITIIKHFAFNDCENHRGDREGENGLVTWMNEQSAREMYLKPFEMTIKTGNSEQFYYKSIEDSKGNISYEKTSYEVPYCNGLMTAFNRIGYTWTGGDYNLITCIVREEWGFDGLIVTDYDNGEFMDVTQMLRAGADLKLHATGAYDYNGNGFTLSRNMNKATYHYVKEAIHHALFSEVNSLAANNLIRGVSITTIGNYVFILLAVDVVALAGIVVLAVFLIRRLRKNDKNNLQNKYKKEGIK